MINKITLLGNVGKDPELTNAGGTDVCKFSVATSESWKDKDGEWQERVTWHNIEVWGVAAQGISQRVSKGDTVYVEGRLDIRSYTDKEDIMRYYTGVNAKQVKIVKRINPRAYTAQGDMGAFPPPKKANFDPHKGGEHTQDELPF